MFSKSKSPFYISIFISSIFFWNLSSARADFSVNVIYGDDNRQDLYQVKENWQLNAADSTVALMFKSDLKLNADQQSYTFTGNQYDYVCSTEAFYKQPSDAFCSGSLVGEDLIITAGHCITSDTDCANVNFVFNYGVATKGVFPTEASAENVYECKEIIKREEDALGADYAVIRTKRKVTNHTPLKINRTGKIDNDTKLVVIGHPSGLPTKVSGGAWVRDNSPAGYFVANLDTYGGNSGSAVFNEKTGLIEGILVRGETDFNYDPKLSCYVSNHCENDGCWGEEATKISKLAALIP